MPRFTFLTNHALVLHLLARNPVMTALEVSFEIGITERAVRRIIADLEKGGYVSKEKEGRRVRYKINHRMPLQHRTQSDKVVGTLLQILG